jgi:hypothetical protein
MTIKRKPVRLLTNLKISEVSAVDRGAGEGCHVLMRKRDGKPDYEAFFGRIFGVKKRHMDGYPPELCKNLDVPVGGPNEPINPGGDDSDGTRVERGTTRRRKSMRKWIPTKMEAQARATRAMPVVSPPINLSAPKAR